MAACPKGHESETTDYCDVCGAAMTPPPSGPAPDGPRPSPTTSPATGSGTATLPRPVIGVLHLSLIHI